MALVQLCSVLDTIISGATKFAASRICAGFPPFPPAPLRGMPLLASPTLPLFLVALYLALAVAGSAVIRARRLRPREREPPLLYAFLLLHNLALFCLSAFLAVSIPLEALRLGYSIWGNVYNPGEAYMAWLIYLFYVSKYMEFGDTVIMLLRFSVRQVSFLHVYHHSTIALIWWLITYYTPGGDGYFSAMLNSVVHVAMYGYYFLAAVLGRNPKLRAKYLFWGKYLTQMQMTQFVLMMCQAVYIIVMRPAYPLCLAVILLVYMCTLLGLFGHFYIQKYKSPRAHDANGSIKPKTT